MYSPASRCTHSWWEAKPPGARKHWSRSPPCPPLPAHCAHPTEGTTEVKWVLHPLFCLLK